jgi:hypothetical protein
MDTQDTKKEGTFKTVGEIEKYEGNYKEGYRDGVGTSTVKIEVMKFTYTMMW